jgi:hypothetical protein
MPKTQHLFTVTGWLLKAATVVSLVVMGLLLLGLGGIAVAIIAGSQWGIPSQVEGIPIGQLLSLGAWALVAAIFCIGLVAVVFLMATRIVETAESGDPFVIQNARRLAQIGWLLLAVQVIGFIANTSLNAMLPHKLADKTNIDVGIGIGFDFSPVGLLAILMIFVLAQIFRHGSELRAELEGTV